MSLEQFSEEQKVAARNFGTYFRNQREMVSETLEVRAERIGFQPEQLMAIEEGNIPLPPPWVIAGWGKKLNLSPAEMVDLEVEAGYLPPINAPLERLD